MFIEYLPGKTFIHSLDIRTKIIGFIVIMLLTFIFNNPLYNAILLVFVCIMAFSTGMPLRKIYKLLVPLIPIYIFILLFTGFTPAERFVLPENQKVIFYLIPDWQLGVTVGGLLQGFSFIFRLLIMVIASSLMTLTTPIDDFIQLFNKLKVPFEFSFAITTALRFIPTMNRKRELIIDAQRARGANLAEKSLFGYIKTSVPIMVPLMVNAIRMANNLSMAMLNRGYGFSKHRTMLKQSSFRPRDYFTCCLIIPVAALGVYLRYVLGKGTL